jgi:hypothetical protein
VSDPQDAGPPPAADDPPEPPPAPDPYADIAFVRPNAAVPAPGTSWRWRDVLSSLDGGPAGSAGGATGSATGGEAAASDGGAPAAAQPRPQQPLSVLAAELRLAEVMPDGLNDRLRALAVRGRDRVKAETLVLAPEAIRTLRNRIRRDDGLRARLGRFVEARREAVARGRLKPEELRLYLVADVCLED